MDIKPTFADTRELGLDDGLQTADPPCFSGCVLQLSDLSPLIRQKAFNTEDLVLRLVSGEDSVVCRNVVALFSNFNHGEDYLVFDEERVEAEVREFLGKVIWWGNRHSTEVRHFLWRSLGRKSQVGRDHVLQFVLRFLHGLIHNNLVHRAAKVKLNFKKDSGGVQIWSSAQVFGGNGMM